nr:hypothetical protein CFP56_23796 [Quercus suber]
MQRIANLARIRDNQRRSRARRKEYLQELETRYRACEQTGVEASAEIQAAARRVVDENKKLRQLLTQTGMSDADIDSMLGEESYLDDSTHSTNATALESLLGVKRQCGPGNSCSPSQSSEGARQSQDCKPLASKDNSTHLRTSTHSPVPLTSSDVDSPIAQYSSPHDLSAASMPISVTGYAHHPYSMHNHSMIVQQQPQQQPFDYNLGQHNMYMTWPSTPHYQAPTATDSTSCYVAADVLRGMKPEAGFEIEEQLGCADGGECNVPNAHIFGLMDQYSDPRNG